MTPKRPSEPIGNRDPPENSKNYVVFLKLDVSRISHLGALLHITIYLPQ